MSEVSKTVGEVKSEAEGVANTLNQAAHAAANEMGAAIAHQIGEIVQVHRDMRNELRQAQAYPHAMISAAAINLAESVAEFGYAAERPLEEVQKVFRTMIDSIHDDLPRLWDVLQEAEAKIKAGLEKEQPQTTEPEPSKD
jgi:hypothetical protein